MLEARQAARSVDRHTDRVESQLVRVRSMAAFDQPTGGHLAHLRSLCRAQAVERAAVTGGQSPGLHFAESERAPVEGDDVELPPTGAVVAVDDLKPASREVLGGQQLAALTEVVPEVCAHGAEATLD